jgi:hypothetical protein
MSLELDTRQHLLAGKLRTWCSRARNEAEPLVSI